ncbi:MAG TPA: outer membrane lipoprotein carrier protein LolA [Bryobacteraceae bacterium]|jgi:outer membrane lipoprotein carrier protein|nr:outer membrane lipoprotein carrier protein LolA [Bryobacteraceae bacterium]
MISLLCSIPQARAASDGRTPALDKLLKAVEARYNRTPSLKLDFSETYAGMRRPVESDSGVLYLRKPGRMRWEYSNGKVFLSDGKEVYLYMPDEHRAERSKLKESEDMRAPLAFLLGKLDFGKEFKDFQSRPDSGGASGGTWIVATPKSENLAYTKVEFLATPDGEIHSVRVTGQDQSKLDFTFSGEKTASVPDSFFKFAAPPGVQVVEAER